MLHTQTIQITDAPPGEIGAQITGIQVNELAADAPELEMIRQAIYRNKLVVIRGQDITPEQYVAFARKMGTPQVYFQENYHHPDFPEIFVSSNVPEPDGRKIGVAGTGHYWHTDCQFQKHPLSFTSIMPVIIPKSLRATYYIDMVKVLKNLPAELRKYVDGKTYIHGGNNRYKVRPCDVDKSIQELIDYMNQIVPPVEHPAVIKHPVTGEEALYISSGFTMQIKGLTYEENKAALQALFSFIEKEEHIYTHHWDKGDLIIWDNRTLLHKSSRLPAGELSKSYRIGIYDQYPFYVGIENNG
ncbi:MAG: TauD/TfdA family dioxygenase [Cytophagaceae bacterium]|nr:TauD/TfdA family dioxygenase [Cytophagaceae bacterium]MDW8455445.1 TauD/TfdA family dioxygenase [Cytophagaceae bacterium]